jgi:arylsulfatase A-like enzyme
MRTPRPLVLRIQTQLTLLLGVLLLSCGALAASPAPKPNVIFILADDLAQGDLGCYGQTLIQTPHLDRMAAEGTRYTQAYCGTTVCAPSRASLMTGLHTGHSPIRGNREFKPEGQLPLPSVTVTVAEVLKTAGYATACVGKWGMGMFDSTGSPLKKGFDHFFGYNCQRHAHSYFPTYLYREDQRLPIPENEAKAKKIYAQNLISEDALQWVRSQAEQKLPFFLYYALTLPHGSHEIDDLGIYRDQPWSELEKTYAAMVTRLDRDVGRLLELLKELGLDENTLVLFSGDNGSALDPKSKIAQHFNQAANGLRGFKRHLNEGALRNAGIARWPGTVPAGAVRHEPWAFWDFLPTAAELAGARLPQGFHTDGVSLVGFLKGGAAPEREFFYWELHEGKPSQAIRFGEWKAIRSAPGKPLELYHLSSDPGEAHNVAESHADKVARAEVLLEQAHAKDPHWPLFPPTRTSEQKR